MAIQHKKEFGIYHWDTFDNTTLLIDEADTSVDAKQKVFDRYGDRIALNGADQVEIVNSKGDVVERYFVC